MSRFWGVIKGNWEQLAFFASMLTGAAGWVWRQKLRGWFLRLRADRQTVQGIPAILAELKALNEQVAELREVVQLSALRWRVTWQLADSGVYETDDSGSCTFANPALCALFGLSEQEMLGRGWLKAVGRTQIERTEIWRQWMDAVKTDIPYRAEYWVAPSDGGAPVFCMTYAEALRSASGKVLRFHGVVKPHPIGERKRSSQDA